MPQTRSGNSQAARRRFFREKSSSSVVTTKQVAAPNSMESWWVVAYSASGKRERIQMASTAFTQAAATTIRANGRALRRAGDHRRHEQEHDRQVDDVVHLPQREARRAASHESPAPERERREQHREGRGRERLRDGSPHADVDARADRTPVDVQAREEDQEDVEAGHDQRADAQAVLELRE